MHTYIHMLYLSLQRNRQAKTMFMGQIVAPIEGRAETPTLVVAGAVRLNRVRC